MTNYFNNADEPKSLGKAKIRVARFSLLQEEHIYPLTRFVEDLRNEKGLENEVPYFDPLDGGIRAKVLFTLEAPGPKAVSSGFISRNNPDESAKNMYNLLYEARFERNETVLWNIVPWYLGTGRKIRPAKNKDIYEGLIYFERLLKLLPSLRAIVLVGKKASKAKTSIGKISNLKIFEAYHPSPLFVNNNPGNRELILKSFTEVQKYTL